MWTVFMILIEKIYNVCVCYPAGPKSSRHCIDDDNTLLGDTIHLLSFPQFTKNGI